MHLEKRLVPVFLFIVGVATLICPTTSSGQNATDIPMWFDVSAGPPTNVRLNTDNSFQLQNEEQVAVDPTNPDNLVAVWRDFRLGFRQVGWAYTHDGGTNWTEGGLVSSTPYLQDSDPGIVAGNNGWFYSVILSFDPSSPANGLFVPVSFDSGTSWFTYIDGIDTPTGPSFEDKELIAIDNTGGPQDGSLYIAWTRFAASTDIFLVAAPGGGSFGLPNQVSDGPGVQWPTPVVDSGGRVIVAWTSFGDDAILCDVSSDQGLTWGTDHKVADVVSGSWLLNGGIGTFSFPALATDISDGAYDGRLYCAFTDLAADGNMDLYMTISDDAGATWTPRQRLNDDPENNFIDQFHPWTYVNEDGVVTVSWYDRRNDPANLDFDLYISHSFDGGQTWTPNQRVSEVSSSPFFAARTAGQPLATKPLDPRIPIEIQSPQAGLIGEYTGLATSNRRATLVFTDTRNFNQDVYTSNMPLRLFPPKLTGPVDGLLTTNANVTFTWEDWSIYDVNLTYVLEYSTDPAFATGVTRMTGLTTQSQAVVLPEDLVYWRVRAFDNFGDSSAVVVHSLHVDNTAPAVPTPISPSPLNGDTIVDPLPTFAWTAATVQAPTVGTPVSYDLDIAANAGFTVDLRSFPDLSATSQALGDTDSLTFGQDWFWRVRAQDGAGNSSSYSATQQFYLKIPFIVGDLNGDEVLDPVDLNLLIDVLFFAGSVPVPPTERADINCDGPLDPIDLNLLIDHLFFGAPAPACP